MKDAYNDVMEYIDNIPVQVKNLQNTQTFGVFVGAVIDKNIEMESNPIGDGLYSVEVYISAGDERAFIFEAIGSNGTRREREDVQKVIKDIIEIIESHYIDHLASYL